MRISESRLQAEVVQALQEAGVYFFSVPNEAAGKNARGMAALKAMGLRAGVSDLVLVLPGKVAFLELKAEGGEQSEAQKRFQAHVESLGHPYRICWSVGEVRAWLFSMI